MVWQFEKKNVFEFGLPTALFLYILGSNLLCSLFRTLSISGKQNFMENNEFGFQHFFGLKKDNNYSNRHSVS
jgi:hypothetical protein